MQSMIINVGLWGEVQDDRPRLVEVDLAEDGVAPILRDAFLYSKVDRPVVYSFLQFIDAIGLHCR